MKITEIKKENITIKPNAMGVKSGYEDMITALCYGSSNGSVACCNINDTVTVNGQSGKVTQLVYNSNGLGLEVHMDNGQKIPMVKLNQLVANKIITIKRNI